MKIKFNLILGILMILTPGLMFGLSGPAMAQTQTYTEVSTWETLQTAITASSTTNPAYLKLGTHMTNPNAPLTIGSGNVVFLDLNGKTLSRGLNEAQTNGHVIKIDGGTLTLNDLSANKTGKITGGNTSGYDGGGVNISNGGTFVMNDGTIQNNNGFNGGGVNVFDENSTFTMKEGATISSNTAGQGGGVYLNGSGARFILEGGTIKDNTCGNGSTGGGVYAYNGTFNMSNGTISGNTAADGGGVNVGSGGSFAMSGGTIQNNTANNNGGGVYVYGTTGRQFKMSGGTISYNKAQNGAGVFADSASTFEMSGGAIKNNEASVYGGGIYARSNITLQGTSEITGNKAQKGGGLFVNSSCNFTMGGGTISGNTATTYGGGIYAEKSFMLQGTPTITDNTVDGNDNNVYLDNFTDTSNTINIASNFKPSSAIGVTLVKSSEAFTSGANYATDAAAQDVFTSDNPAYEVYANTTNQQAALKAVHFKLWVGEEEVTGDHLANDTKTWRFDPWTNTLTLEKFTYSGGGHSSGSDSNPQYGCIYYDGDKDFILEIKDTNSLTNTNNNTQSEHYRNSHGIYCTKPLTITGEGKLTTTSIGTIGAMGINCSQFIEIVSGTVEAKGNNYGILGQNGVTISGGSVKAEGYGTNGSYGIYGTANKTLTIVEGVKSVIISGTGAAVYGQLSVKNAVKGFGWTDTARTEGKTEIAINTTQNLSHLKKLQFPVYDVTFKVRGGAWNDGTTGDQTVTPDLVNGEQKLTQGQIPAVGARPSSGYKTGSWNVTPDTTTPITQNTTYTYSYAPKSRITRTVTFKVEHGAWDDGTTEDKTVILTGYEGDTLKLQANQIPAVGGKPDKRYTAGNWDTVPNPDTPITADTVYTYAYAKKPVIIPTLYFAAHVQNLGWDKENKTLEPGKSVDVGTTGRSLRMEALVLMVPEAFTVDGFAHVQDVGDLAVREVKSSKDYTIPEGYHAYEFGTTGKSRRVEALCAAVRNDDGDYVSGFQYAAHLQNYGWQGYVRNGSFAGTRGMALRMEAMRFVYAIPDVVPPGEPK